MILPSCGAPPLAFPGGWGSFHSSPENVATISCGLWHSCQVRILLRQQRLPGPTTTEAQHPLQHFVFRRTLRTCAWQAIALPLSRGGVLAECQACPLPPHRPWKRRDTCFELWSASQHRGLPPPHLDTAALSLRFAALLKRLLARPCAQLGYRLPPSAFCHAESDNRCPLGNVFG